MLSLSATGFVLELQPSRHLRLGLLVQMPRCRPVYVCVDLFAYFPIHEIQRLSGISHRSTHILALVPVCVCGRVSFQGICLEMHPGVGGAAGRRASVSQFLYNAAELCSPPTAASPGGEESDGFSLQGRFPQSPGAQKRSACFWLFLIPHP